MAIELKPKVGDQQSKKQFHNLWHKIYFSLYSLLYMKRLIWQMGTIGGVLSIRPPRELVPLQQEVASMSEDDSSEKTDCKEKKYTTEEGSLFWG